MDGATEMGFNLVLLKRGDRRGLTPLSSFPVSDFGVCSLEQCISSEGKSWARPCARPRAVIEPP